MVLCQDVNIYYPVHVELFSFYVCSAREGI